MFPLFLNLKDRLSVVVGGGPVGRRKAAALLAAGGRVRLVCLEPRPPELATAMLDWVVEPFQPAHLEGAVLAFAAGPAEINRLVAAEARRRGIWVNIADDPAGSAFFVPATVRRGDFVIAISTQGATPALARRVRLRLDEQFDDAFGQWVALLAEMRPIVRARLKDPAQRRRLWRSLTHRRWLGKLRRQGADEVRRTILARIETLAQI